MSWRRLAATAATLCAALLVVPAPAGAAARAAARAAEPCRQPVQPSPVFKGTPVEDQVYAPKRLAPLATGRGVRVAVIDSGVDGKHPQLRGRVERGKDFLHGDADGLQDCIGHGTGVASLIAAKPEPDTGFQGLAPGAVIVPVRISEQQEIDGKAVGDNGSPAQFAQAIDWAAGPGRAQVINLSLVMTGDNSLVAAAVRRAIAKGVVVVAAAGNHGDQAGGGPLPFPAAYDGVIGVGAVQADGTRAAFSQQGRYVDLVAIGKGVTMAALGAGHTAEDGTSFSTPLVAATAALILERFPRSTPADVERRLKATADPAPGGGTEYGAGLLNPYRAVTETLVAGNRPPVTPEVMHPNDPAAEALASRRAHSQDMALWIAAVGAGLVLLMVAAALIVRRGRERRWRPADPAQPEPAEADLIRR
ncbi:type VII secretion-associated serine protease mycosin [Actinoplanes sp. CA-030573]|uniref:type VII secretion-associated serine protease mycosin n=1 Tax=Actinoplanes sp. CA-030573 TaxID=3239898 RepID=UPI003D9357C8